MQAMIEKFEIFSDEKNESKYVTPSENVPSAQVVDPKSKSESEPAGTLRKIFSFLGTIVVVGFLIFSVVSWFTGDGDSESGSLAIDLYNQGNTHKSEGEYDEAIEDFTRAIELDPEYVNAYCNRGYSYHELEEYEEAIDSD